MPLTVLRTTLGMSTYASVVISPATTTRPVVSRVSQATRAFGSCSKMASRTASETWSAILSGWPSVTDSDVKVKRSLTGAGPLGVGVRSKGDDGVEDRSGHLALVGERDILHRAVGAEE